MIGNYTDFVTASMKKFFLSFFLCLLFFILAFFIEYFSGILFKLSLVFIEKTSELLGLELTRGNPFSITINTAVLFGFMVSLPFATYLLQIDRIAKNIQKNLSWRYIIGIGVIFFLGLFVAYIQTLYPFFLGKAYIGDSLSVSIDVNKLFNKLLISQWAFGLSFTFLWIQFFPREKN